MRATLNNVTCSTFPRCAGSWAVFLPATTDSKKTPFGARSNGIRATGAVKIQEVMFGVIPQLLPRSG
jgi:hypothetical protein